MSKIKLRISRKAIFAAPRPCPAGREPGLSSEERGMLYRAHASRGKKS